MTAALITEIRRAATSARWRATSLDAEGDSQSAELCRNTAILLDMGADLIPLTGVDAGALWMLELARAVVAHPWWPKKSKTG